MKKLLENNRIFELIKKIFTREVILYIIFGVLTTVVNLAVFALLNSALKVDENLSNAVAIIIAVLVAYFTNKDMVFHSQASNFKSKLVEFFKFILGRAVTMILEYFGGMLLFNYLPIPNIISKCIITVIVIILNFFISKFFAFKHKK